jgi:hypothetical protein
MVVSGAPISSINHSERICKFCMNKKLIGQSFLCKCIYFCVGDMAMDVIDASGAIEDPSGVGMQKR